MVAMVALILQMAGCPQTFPSKINKTVHLLIVVMSRQPFAVILLELRLPLSMKMRQQWPENQAVATLGSGGILAAENIPHRVLPLIKCLRIVMYPNIPNSLCNN